eukprot:s1162_g15.t1
MGATGARPMGRLLAKDPQATLLAELGLAYSGLEGFDEAASVGQAQIGQHMQSQLKNLLDAADTPRPLGSPLGHGGAAGFSPQGWGSSSPKAEAARVRSHELRPPGPEYQGPKLEPDAAVTLDFVMELVRHFQHHKNVPLPARYLCRLLEDAEKIFEVRDKDGPVHQLSMKTLRPHETENLVIVGVEEAGLFLAYVRLNDNFKFIGTYFKTSSSALVKENLVWLQSSSEKNPFGVPGQTSHMVSAGSGHGGSHMVLLRSDGCAVACGRNGDGQCSIPPLHEGVTYTQVSAGGLHTVLLRSDGCAVACGRNDAGQCNIPPPLDKGVTYTQVSAGFNYTVLLRSDGCAVACGRNDRGQCSIPPLDECVKYTQVAAGSFHTVLLQSDGSAVACGRNNRGQCSIPPLDEGVTYTQVSAGRLHTVLLRSDGCAIACGLNDEGQCNIPPLDEGVTYTQVSAGNGHTVLLRSDGCAVGCGRNGDGQCSIPPLDEGVTYTQVSAGSLHTALLRSDGCAVCCGRNGHGQCRIPSLKSWSEWLGFQSPSLLYISDLTPLPGKPERVLQLCFDREADAIVLICLGLDGLEVLRFRASGAELAAEISRELALKAGEQQVRVVLPDGQLLEAVCATDPSVTLATLCFKHGLKTEMQTAANPFDLHGQLADLLWIFFKVGVPSPSNRFLFNGDICDRGENAAEIWALLFAFMSLWPESVYIHRGNHEDRLLNMDYHCGGFYEEVLRKYGRQGTGQMIYEKFGRIFARLPLASVVDNQIFVVHGGLSRGAPGSFLRLLRANRHRNPEIPSASAGASAVDLAFIDAMWADPQEYPGSSQNPRGPGLSAFGPDVTERFLQETGYALVVRSHQVPPNNDGFYVHHNRKLFTVFSASNYCGLTGNQGAVLILKKDSSIEAVRHMAPAFERLQEVVIEAPEVAEETPAAVRRTRQLQRQSTAGQVELREAQASLKDEERAQKMYQEVFHHASRWVVEKKAELFAFWEQCEASPPRGFITKREWEVFDDFVERKPIRFPALVKISWPRRV